MLASGLLVVVLGAAAAPQNPARWFHDFWIAPSSFRPAVGSSVDVSLHVGHLGHYTPYVRNPAHIRRFVAVFSDSVLSLPGTPGRDPAGTVTLPRPGLAVIGYHSHASATELPAARFENYLREEGLDHILALRQRRGEAQRPGREKFSRCAKALMQVGGSGSQGYDRHLGFTLELVPSRNPYDLAPGDTLAVQLLFRGRPLPNAQVTAVPASATRAPVLRRTNADGRVRLPLGRAGVWLVKSVHMLPAAGDPAADWESFWATFTFELPFPAQ